MTKEELEQIHSLFDGFMSSPNSVYYDVKTQAEYPIGSKSRRFKSIDEAIREIPRYRQMYEKLILYTFEYLEENCEYKVRFAGFPPVEDPVIMREYQQRLSEL